MIPFVVIGTVVIKISGVFSFFDVNNYIVRNLQMQKDLEQAG